MPQLASEKTYDNNYLVGKATEQYDSYPYPPRDPNEEEKRIVVSHCDYLGKVNHYCFGGKRSLRDDFRVLVAGGGTGDSLIFLASQLRDCGAEVTYLDISKNSMEIAQARAEKRGLTNIKWVHGSLLDLEKLDLGTFNYINCLGVIHHVEDPAEGLRQLRKVLKDDGAMCASVSAKYGLVGADHIRKLIDYLADDPTDIQDCLNTTKGLFPILPPTNWLRRGQDNISEILANGESGLLGMFHYAGDPTYNVKQVYELLAESGFSMIEFAEAKLRYDPQFIVPPTPLTQKIFELTKEKKAEIAELLLGSGIKHTFYLSPQTKEPASMSDLDNVPFINDCAELPETITEVVYYEKIKDAPVGAALSIAVAGANVTLTLGPSTALIFKYMDRMRSIGEIVDQVLQDEKLKGQDIDAEVVMTDFQRLYSAMHTGDLILLRHKSVPPFQSAEEHSVKTTEG